MTHIVFTDPNIAEAQSFEFNGHVITAPVFTASEIPHIVHSTRHRAAGYFSDHHEVFDILGESYRVWQNPAFDLRQEALPLLAELTGFSQETLVCFGLEPLGHIFFEPDMLEQLPRRLVDLVERGEYRHFVAWDEGFIKGYGTPRLALHDGIRQIVQIMAGNIIGPTWLLAILGAISRSPQFIKLPSRDPASFMFYLQALESLDPAFRSTIACGYYRGGDSVEDDLLAEPATVFAMGSDETVNAIQDKIGRINPLSRLIPHGLKISFQAVSREYAIPEVAELAVWGAIAYDGNGCFSPANIYVERGGPLGPYEFAEAMAEHMATVAQVIPPKKTWEAAERVNAYRMRQYQRKLLGEDVRVIKSEGADYTIIVDSDDPCLVPTCQERTVIVKPVDDIGAVPQYVSRLARNLQTVGLAVPGDEVLEIADQLGAAGVTNVKMVGREFTLRLSEPHDGLFDTVQPFMSDGLRWVHVSFTDTEAEIDRALREKAGCLSSLPA
jgi:hypothetical protein